MGPQRRRVLSPPPCSYRPRSATPPLSAASLPSYSLHPIEVSGWVCPSPAPEASRRPGVPDASGGCPGPSRKGDAHPSARLRARPPAAPGQGLPGDSAPLAGSCRVPGANSDVAPSALQLLSTAAAGGTAGRESGGAVRVARPEGAGGGRREPGVAVGSEPEAGLGWIINTLGGIRHAGSRPARARAPQRVPANRRAGLKGGSV